MSGGIHEAPKTCGFGTQLSATIAEHATLYLKVPVIRGTGYDAVMLLARFEDYYVPNAQRIQKALNEVMKY